ncbi:Nucleotidyltransferase [Ramaria rubella]|nr:Nucleotidyltransferase [Ramaria rubella]
MHELYKQRMAHRFPKRFNDTKGKNKQEAESFTNEHSVIEDFSVYDSQGEDNNTAAPFPRKMDAASSVLTTISMASNPRPSNMLDEDPLLPFYAKAREEAKSADVDNETQIPTPVIFEDFKASRLKGFQCDKTGTHLHGASPNWDIIEKLAELKELHRDMGTDDDKWRVISYQKAIGSLKSHLTRIKSREEALKLTGVSDKTADKIMEIIRTGELQRIKYTKTQDLTAMRIFSGIYGVGPSTARKWYHQGLRSLEDVRQAVSDGAHKLSIAQEIGLRFYDDINDRMPRIEAEEIFFKIKPIALGLDPRLSLDIMGSFRRGKETCGDIDILLTRPTDDGRTHGGILPHLCNLLHKQGILTEDLAVPEDWEALEATYRGLCRKDEYSKRRRIDILCIPYESRGAARIYYTGDDIFNRSIRLKANKMNMSLNQRGLFQGVVRDPQDRTKKLCTGSLLCSDSERKIFEILGVPWQKPHERVRG